MMPDNDKEDALTAGFLIQPFQEWGVPPELIYQIGLSLTDFVPKIGFPVEQGRQERPGILRIFCQNNVIADPKAAKTSRTVQAGPTLEVSPEAPLKAPLKASPIQDPSSTILNRGWGFFIVDRSCGGAGSSEECSHRVDLYLYQEGE